jgi:diphthamide biosynthesis methyltransferase
MSAAGRKRISEAAKKMWAERKKATILSPGRPMSAATKRKLSQSAKARWSEKKKAKTT